jgi:hypothetical protein
MMHNSSLHLKKFQNIRAVYPGGAIRSVDLNTSIGLGVRAFHSEGTANSPVQPRRNPISLYGGRLKILTPFSAATTDKSTNMEGVTLLFTCLHFNVIQSLDLSESEPTLEWTNDNRQGPALDNRM